MEKDLYGEGGLVWRRWTCKEKVDLYGEGGLVSSFDRLPVSGVSHIRMSARCLCLTNPGSGGEGGRRPSVDWSPVSEVSRITI